MSSQIFFCAPMSGASNHESRNDSIFGSVGQPNHAPLPLPRRGKCPPGSATDRPDQDVQKTFQPPLSGGSREARRATSVDQSMAANLTLMPTFSNTDRMTCATCAKAGWSVGDI